MSPLHNQSRAQSFYVKCIMSFWCLLIIFKKKKLIQGCLWSMDTLEVCLHVSVSIDQKWQPSECNSVRFEFYNSSHCYCSNDSLHLFLSVSKFLCRFSIHDFFLSQRKIKILIEIRLNCMFILVFKLVPYF